MTLRDRQREFEEAIRPVVEEYEKTLTTLEQDLARTKSELDAAQLELLALRHDRGELYQIQEE